MSSKVGHNFKKCRASGGMRQSDVHPVALTRMLSGRLEACESIQHHRNVNAMPLQHNRGVRI